MYNKNGRFQNSQKVIKYYKYTVKESLYIQDLGRDSIHDRKNYSTKSKIPTKNTSSIL